MLRFAGRVGAGQLARSRGSCGFIRRAVRVEPPRGAEREGASWGTAGDEDDARLHHDDCDASSPHVSRVDALRRVRARRRGGRAARGRFRRAPGERLAHARVLGPPGARRARGYGHTLYGSELFPYAMGSWSPRARARRGVWPRRRGADVPVRHVLAETVVQERARCEVRRRRITRSELELTIREQVNAYTGERARLSTRARVSLRDARRGHCVDASSPSFVTSVRESAAGLEENERGKMNASRVRHSPPAFFVRGCCGAAAAVHSGRGSETSFPTLERASSPPNAGPPRLEATRAPRAEVERLRRCTFDAWLVARATGIA